MDLNTRRNIRFVCENLGYYKSKKHGGYHIYEDDKIRMDSDTYVPNIDVYVKTPDGKKTLVLLHSGCSGLDQEYHSGKWEEYVETLMPKATEASKKHEKKRLLKESKELNLKFCSADDELNKVFKENK